MDFADFITGGVEFTPSQQSDKALQLSRLVQQQSAKPHYQQVLLGALSKDLQSVLEEQEKQGKVPEIFVLSETIEPLDGTGLDNFRQISNWRVFCDRLYATGM